NYNSHIGEGFPLSIKGEKLTVSIDRLDDRGSGQAVVSRENKKGKKRQFQLTIPYTLPGETVRAKVEYPRKRRSISRVDEVIAKHPDRIETRFPNFERVAVCTGQHLLYKDNYAKKQTV